MYDEVLPRRWSWGVESGAPQPALWVRVRPEDAPRLRELVLAVGPGPLVPQESEGVDLHLVDAHAAGRLEQERLTGEPERVLIYADVSVDGPWLRISADYVDDADVLEAQGQVAAAVARRTTVEEWSLVELYEGRTWTGGESSRSLVDYLGLGPDPGPEPDDATGPGWTPGLRGDVEDGVVVRVARGQRAELATLVEAEAAGHRSRWWRRSAPRGLSVQGRHLVLEPTQGDPERCAAHEALLRRVADGLVVERWSEGEGWAGRPWAGGRDGASLRAHLGG